MSTIPKSKGNPAQLITHRHMQRVFNRHRHKFDRHRLKGPAFAKALDDLEKTLFGEELAAPPADGPGTDTLSS